jgi:hypothetical protein
LSLLEIPIGLPRGNGAGAGEAIDRMGPVRVLLQQSASQIEPLGLWASLARANTFSSPIRDRLPSALRLSRPNSLMRTYAVTQLLQQHFLCFLSNPASGA